VDPVILEHQLLIKLLVEVPADPLMLLLDIRPDFVQPLLDHFEMIVEFRLDDVFVVIYSIQVDRRLDHLLQLGQTVVALLDNVRASRQE
jgi:hypothetical protein